MELYQTFNTIFETVGVFFDTTKAVFIGCAIGAFSLWIALFVLQGVGLVKMAKNRGIKHRWLAFIPFVNLLYIGKLVGTCIVFGRPMKRTGLYAMIAQLLFTVAFMVWYFIEIYLNLNYGTPQHYDSLGAPNWELGGVVSVLEIILKVCFYPLPILQLVYTIFIAILSFALYKKYAPGNYFILGLLTIFVPLSRYIIVFALRKRQAVNFEEYMRKRREDFVRQQQQYGYGPYGTPYNNPYATPYQPPRQQDESPFSDFCDENKQTNDPNDPDGFFD